MATQLLNDDGNASIASALMMSHHAFRRDLAQFAIALEKIAAGQPERATAVGEEWTNFRQALHGHHTVEDTNMFPGMRADHAELAHVFDRLGADHRRIDPLLDRGDELFAALPGKAPEALKLVNELIALLDAHLTLEEANVVQFLRAANAFPPPANDTELDMYAQGFAWSSHGIAPEVLERVYAILPAALSTRLPAARKTYEARCERVWGTAKTGASRTSVPDWLSK